MPNASGGTGNGDRRPRRIAIRRGRMAPRSIRSVQPQLFFAVTAETVLQMRSVLLLPQAGHRAPAEASDIGRVTSNVLWQS
jgi:hypothetical protein